GHPETVSRHPEFVSMFGENVAAELAVYHHRHDHDHDVHGDVVPHHDHDHDHEDYSHG
ncbi:MAG: zinc ABC transporter ATP-binding protein ZnuC, partial [Rhodospirillaceae bacterium]|nr:zinc ABC transporter ATP-binding protein ZnuC [Rhodospirillaceae bacterium]